MKILEFFKNILYPKLNLRTVWSGEYIKTVIRLKYPKVSVIKTWDTEYTIPTVDYINEILSQVAVPNKWYKDNKFDCDDFAFILLGKIKELTQGLALGFCVVSTVTDNHLCLFFIDITNNIFFIEGQSKIITQNERYSILDAYI